MATPQEIRERTLALQANRKPQPLDFPAWGDDIYIRVLSANDQMLLAEGDDATMPLRIVLACLVTDEGERIFTDDDLSALGDFPFPEVMEVFGRVARLNGLSTVELDEAMESFAPAPDEQRSTASL